MTEPMSLLPLCRFGAEYAILVGDPLQLAPTLTTSTRNPAVSLERTLFERLSDSGYSVSFLRTQYRCNPSIAQVSNTLFYSSKLNHGAEIERVSSLIYEIPSLVFVNVDQGREESARGGSLSNSFETREVVRLVKLLTNRGIPPSEIGVITFYKNQAYSIHSQLRSECQGIQVINTLFFFEHSLYYYCHYYYFYYIVPLF